MDIITAIFGGASSVISGFTGMLGNSLTAVTALFYDSATTSLTLLGVLSVIALGVGVVYWAFGLIRGLIARRQSLPKVWPLSLKTAFNEVYMKKLTKTQKQNLKKKLLRTFNIIGLIVGGLSFIVVLYAIIAGGLAANNSDATTADILEDAPAERSLVQRALPPPSDYDLSLQPVDMGGLTRFYWNSTDFGSILAQFSEHSATIDYFSNSHYFRGLTITTNVYAPTTTMQSLSSDMWAFVGGSFGSHYSQPAFNRFRITLDNINSKRSFLFYGDFSSSGYNVGAGVALYDNDNNFISNLSYYISYISMDLRGYYVPPYSKLVFTFSAVDTSQYLDALYINDIGSAAYDTGYGDGFEVSYDTGYGDGYADGVAATTASTNAVKNAFDLIYAGAQSVDKILSISIFGSITLGMLLFTPLIVGISLAIIKIIKGQCDIMFTLVLNWIKPFIIGFAGAWSWLITPLVSIPELNHSFYGGLISFTSPAFEVSPIGVISVGGFAVLFIFGVAKTVLDAIPVI